MKTLVILVLILGSTSILAEETKCMSSFQLKKLTAKSIFSSKACKKLQSIVLYDSAKVELCENVKQKTITRATQIAEYACD